MKHRFLTPALKELGEAALYYESKAANLGSDFFDEIEKAIENILAFPLAYPEISERTRRYRLQRFPYGIMYQIRNSEQILIVSVMHLKRHPDTWKRNL